MAYTVAILKKLSVGNQKCHVLSITADAATQNVDSGLSYIDDFTVGCQSMASTPIKIFANSGAAGTAIAGTLGISGAASGDVFFVRVYGR
jgi:hypothetical protein